MLTPGCGLVPPSGEGSSLFSWGGQILVLFIKSGVMLLSNTYAPGDILNGHTYKLHYLHSINGLSGL